MSRPPAASAMSCEKEADRITYEWTDGNEKERRWAEQN